MSCIAPRYDPYTTLTTIAKPRRRKRESLDDENDDLAGIGNDVNDDFWLISVTGGGRGEKKVWKCLLTIWDGRRKDA